VKFERIARIFRAEGGNIAISAALTAPLLIAGLAISVDYYALIRQEQNQQATVDLAAIAAAVDPSQTRLLLQRYYADNGLRYGVKEGNKVYLPDGLNAETIANEESAPECIATVEVGQFTADASIPVTQRFQPSSTATNAVRVHQQCRGHLYFASSIVEEPELNVSATASSKKLASFWIGTRLASLDGGLTNAVLGALFGTSISLKVVDYDALLSANIDLLPTLDVLASNINMSAVTYDDLLDADITLVQFFKAIRVGGNVKASVQATLRSLEIALSKSHRTIKLKQILNLSAIGNRQVGTGYTGTSTADAYGLIRAAAAVSNGQHQVELEFDYNIPGIGNANFRLMIGEPPVGAQSVAINEPGSLVRTAQVRAMVTFTLGDLPALAGATLNVPIYLEVANSEARLASIRCDAGGGVAAVNVETHPGLTELTLGNVDEDAFINFGNKPRVTPATLLTIPGVTVKGSAQVDVKNIAGTLMKFTRPDIEVGKVKNGSVTTPYTSYMSSLIGNLNLEVKAFGIAATTDQIVYRNAVIAGLSMVTIPADKLLAAYMAVWGYKIGEADVSVTGASCATPSLVL
jgi:uncharacterized membrane protein